MMTEASIASVGDARLASLDSSLDRSASIGNKTSIASSSAAIGAQASTSNHLNGIATSSRRPFAANGHANATTSSRHGEHNGEATNENGTGATEDLWGSILKSVQSSKATSVKNVIILGHPQSGKSTLLSQLAAISPSGFLPHQYQSLDDTSLSNPAVPADTGLHGGQQHDARNSSAADLGLGYGYFDIGDEDGEDIVARVGVYQISSSHPASLSLLPFALPTTGVDAVQQARASKDGASKVSSRGPKGSLQNARDKAASASSSINARPRPSIEAIQDSLFIVVLDWEMPWTFLSQLVEWLDIIGDLLRSASPSAVDGKADQSESVATIETLKKQLKSYIQSYSEPSAGTNGVDGEITGDDEAGIGETSTASAIVAVSNPTAGDDEERAALPDGSLTQNLGAAIVIVCTKADTISQLERQRNFKEEQFDYIQQVLRTICLKYGAGLFFTSQTRPQSYDVLRQYVLHRLLSPERHHTATGAFPFTHRASTVERDILLVPAGWDSFGKIRALREGFDCASMANGWEWDVQVERVRRLRGLAKGSVEAEEVAAREIDRRILPGLVESEAAPIGSAVKLYEDIIEDWDSISQQTTSSANARVKEPDHQAFLQQHYATLQRESEQRPKLGRGQSGSSNEVAGAGSLRSVVGPMGSASLSLPSVERMMQERQLSDEGGRGSGAISSSSTGLTNSGNGAAQKTSSRRDPISTSVRDSAFSRQDTSGGRSTPTQAFRNAAGGEGGRSAVHSPSLSSSDRGLGGTSRPTSPLGGQGSGAVSPTAGTQTPKQSEVLHSFFQSLLKEKTPSSQSGLSRSLQTGSNSRSGANAGQSESSRRA